MMFKADSMKKYAFGMITYQLSRRIDSNFVILLVEIYAKYILFNLGREVELLKLTTTRPCFIIILSIRLSCVTDLFS